MRLPQQTRHASHESEKREHQAEICRGKSYDQRAAVLVPGHEQLVEVAWGNPMIFTLPDSRERGSSLRNLKENQARGMLGRSPSVNPSAHNVEHARDGSTDDHTDEPNDGFFHEYDTSRAWRPPGAPFDRV